MAEDDIGLISDVIQNQIKIEHLDAIKGAVGRSGLSATLDLPDFILANVAIDAIVSFATGKRVLERHNGRTEWEESSEEDSDHYRYEPKPRKKSNGGPVIFYEGKDGINLYDSEPRQG